MTHDYEARLDERNAEADAAQEAHLKRLEQIRDDAYEKAGMAQRLHDNREDLYRQIGWLADVLVRYETGRAR